MEHDTPNPPSAQFPLWLQAIFWFSFFLIVIGLPVLSILPPFGADMIIIGLALKVLGVILAAVHFCYPPVRHPPWRNRHA